MEHDLRTPFSGIGGIANLLHSMYSTKYPELSEYFELMVRSCAQWEAIHNRIFDVLAIEQEEPVHKELISLSQELIAIQDMLAATLHFKSLRLILDPIPETLKYLKTAPLKFHLILSSIVSNAINFTEKGQITITVSQENEFCVIAVKDTGIGIPADKFDYIFEKFTKLSRSNKHGGNFKGVGLGLYAAKHNVDLLGGVLEIKSKLGEGSIFTIKLPLHQ